MFKWNKNNKNETLLIVSIINKCLQILCSGLCFWKVFQKQETNIRVCDKNNSDDEENNDQSIKFKHDQQNNVEQNDSIKDIFSDLLNSPGKFFILNDGFERGAKIMKIMIVFCVFLATFFSLILTFSSWYAWLFSWSYVFSLACVIGIFSLLLMLMIFWMIWVYRTLIFIKRNFKSSPFGTIGIGIILFLSMYFVVMMWWKQISEFSQTVNVIPEICYSDNNSVICGRWTLINDKWANITTYCWKSLIIPIDKVNSINLSEDKNAPCQTWSLSR